MTIAIELPCVDCQFNEWAEDPFCILCAKQDFVAFKKVEETTEEET